MTNNQSADPQIIKVKILEVKQKYFEQLEQLKQQRAKTLAVYRQVLEQAKLAELRKAIKEKK
jgi:flagellar biosynthesis/type III secretory pathway chaperone